MKPSYFLVFIILGLLLTYFGVFGLSGIGMILGGSHYVAYDMNDLNWATTSPQGVAINPSGQLFLDHTNLALEEVYARDTHGMMIEPALPITFELSLSLDVTVEVSLRILVNTQGRLCALVIHKATIEVYSDASGTTKTVAVATHVLGTFYTYRVVLKDMGYDVYRDDNLITSGVPVPNQWLTYFVFFGLRMVNGYEAKAHVDYFYANAGAVLPTYDVNISAYCNTEEKSLTSPVAADGGTQYNTPKTFTFAKGTSHTIAIMATSDGEGHSFLGWDSKTDKGIFLAISDAGDHVAHYQEVVVPPPQTYRVNAYAHDDTTNQNVNVQIEIQNNPSLARTTPCYWDFNVGTTWILIAPPTDSLGNMFLGWDSATDGMRSLSVSSAKTVTTHYKNQDAGIHIPVTVQYYNGTNWQNLGNQPLQHYWRINTATDWVLVESVSTNQYGLYDCWSSQTGIHKFTTTYQGKPYFAETPPCTPGEYWPLLLKVGDGPNPFVLPDFQPFMLYSGLGMTIIGSVGYVVMPGKKRRF